MYWEVECSNSGLLWQTDMPLTGSQPGDWTLPLGLISLDGFWVKDMETRCMRHLRARGDPRLRKGVDGGSPGICNREFLPANNFVHPETFWYRTDILNSPASVVSRSYNFSNKDSRVLAARLRDQLDRNQTRTARPPERAS